jgi:hypothetical protein
VEDINREKDPFLGGTTLTLTLVPESISTRQHMLDNWKSSNNVHTNKDGVTIKLINPEKLTLQ